MDFSQKILSWYAKNKRQLPWRTTKNPYNIWLSEVILQQTRVAQGLPYYNKFIDEFPTVTDLAAATEEEVLKLWQGLGYYSRARNMHASAKYVVQENGGTFPKTHEGLMKLKGVGDYTASAIASICYDEPQPVVDGNVYRVLSRYFAVDLPINSTKGAKYFRELAGEVMNKENIRDYNQGIMEFGAIQCVPKKPDCSQCLLNSGCEALKLGKVAELPVKLKKNNIRKRFFNYMVFIDPSENTLLEKRLKKDIWQNLYQFPLLETQKELIEDDIGQIWDKAMRFGKVSSIKLFNHQPIVHKLSHQHLNTKFWIVELTGSLQGGVPVEKLKDYPVPVLVADFIKTYKF